VGERPFSHEYIAEVDERMIRCTQGFIVRNVDKN
jgi:hypothetical protein